MGCGSGALGGQIPVDLSPHSTGCALTACSQTGFADRLQKLLGLVLVIGTVPWAVSGSLWVCLCGNDGVLQALSKRGGHNMDTTC